MFAGIGTIRPTDTVICRRADQPEPTCDPHTSIVPSGKYTRIVTRLPFGPTWVSVYRNGQSVLEARVNVTERIIGADPDVLDCFTDTSLQDEGFTGTGCSGWEDPVVANWGQRGPLPSPNSLVRLHGPLLRRHLTALEPLFTSLRVGLRRPTSACQSCYRHHKRRGHSNRNWHARSNQSPPGARRLDPHQWN